MLLTTKILENTIPAVISHLETSRNSGISWKTVGISVVISTGINCLFYKYYAKKKI